jgi:CubicO group peptidase (beta-lactamase class C family)
MKTLVPARPAYVPDGPCPGAAWETRAPQAVGLRRDALEALARHVGGRGVVVRGGYLAYAWGAHTASGDLASARKPVISTLLLCAVQEGLISGPDETLDRYVPGLREINGGKDAAITWKHLASQTSGYGWSEKPGEAWSYNDFALALYVDTLFDRALKLDPTEALHRWISRPLRFQDDSHFNAETQPGVRRRGRIAMSPRDHARFGLFYLRGGRWHGKQLLRRDLVDEALTSVVPAELPATEGIDAAMLPGQESHGGGKRTNARGPGQYSYNWWLNLPDRHGRPLFQDAPPDAVVAIGLGLTRGLWVIPSLDLVVAWQGANWSEDDKVNPGEPQTPHNVAARLITEACA